MGTVAPEPEMSAEAPPGEGTCRRWRPAPVGDESRARQRVVDLLSERFPERSAAEVEDAVADAWAEFDRAVLRDFVPVLAARAATDALRRR